MAQINGVVEKIWENQNKFGDTTYTVVVDNVKYGTYKTKPPCQQGDSVTFSAKQNDAGFWNADAKTIRKIAGAVPVTVAAPQAPSTGGGYRKDDAVQNSIIYQNARGHAITLMGVLIDKDILDMGTKTKGKKIETILTYLDKMTSRFYDDTKNLGHNYAEEEEAPEEEAPKPVRKAAKAAPVQEEQDGFDDEIPF